MRAGLATGVAIVLLIGACAVESRDCWTPLGDPAGSEHLFHLWFYNQSDNRKPVDLTLDIDGDEAACLVFDRHTQLEAVRFDFALAPGSHLLHVSTDTTELVESIEVGSELWGILDVSVDAEDSLTDLELIVQGEPTVFDTAP